jgi:hypothetical protein
MNKNKEIRSEAPIIFCHYGNPSYLSYTLKCATLTNPGKRRILLGDESNKKVAQEHDWEHFYFECSISRLDSRFNSSFKHVQGIRHNPYKNGRDWLKFVFERWMFVHAFMSSNLMERIWHFDSDTMILNNLTRFESKLSSVQYTTQCNDTCLNGFVSFKTIDRFCEHICELFENENYIKSQQKEFNEINSHYAFTEMRAFQSYMETIDASHIHLASFSNKEVFDDALCQDHQFESVMLNNGKYVKSIYSRNGKIFCVRNDKEYNFITLNLSWLPDQVYMWVLSALSGKDMKIDQIKFPIMEKMKGYIRRLRTFIKF